LPEERDDVNQRLPRKGGGKEENCVRGGEGTEGGGEGNPGNTDPQKSGAMQKIRGESKNVNNKKSISGGTPEHWHRKPSAMLNKVPDWFHEGKEINFLKKKKVPWRWLRRKRGRWCRKRNLEGAR